jgi:type I restriction enzyme, S subunit
VLISKLNPATNRTWLCLPSSEVKYSVCSTEYVVLEPTNVSIGALFATVSGNEVGEGLVGATTGTSASHQRVRASEVVTMTVADPRSLSLPAQRKLDALIDLYVVLGEELTSLQKLRDFALPRLVSGELRVKAAESLVKEAS